MIRPNIRKGGVSSMIAGMYGLIAVLYIAVFAVILGGAAWANR